MHIYVFGNLNGGKTHLCRKLADKLPSFQYLSIDSFRCEYGDGSLAGEELACHHFVHAVAKSPDAIVDFTGCGKAANLLQALLPEKRGVLICCERDMSGAIAAIDEEKYTAIPYPEEYKQLQSVEETICNLFDQVQLSSLEQKWQQQIWQSYSFQYGQDFDEFWQAFALQHHLWVEKLYRLILGESAIGAAVLYGSMGANWICLDSDIDLFIESALPASYWYQVFSLKFSSTLLHVDLLDEKITLRTTDCILIEVSVGQTVSDNALYYRESQIYNPVFTVLKDREGLAEELQTIISKSPDCTVSTQKIAAQTFFLFCSLPRLIRACDTYKYTFHTMIIQHYCVQLEHLLLGVTEHNYLPKQAGKTLPDFPWHCFSASGSAIDKAQYFSLYDYLQTLFERLESQGLIEQGKYFTSETIKLHFIE
ncbi:hypothetical protein [Photobacterium kasasachensis]|uniref:hypothetical protein n=1 Tax=Photobacterium kasasachensis TaxID=2910240 RepID=UPI003D10D3D9